MTFLLAILFAVTARASETVSFEKLKPGELPTAWIAGASGEGTAKWGGAKDSDGKMALQQSGSATFPWCVNPKFTAADGALEVGIRLLSGKEDQAGGLAWRWKDTDNYYIARINALEDTAAFFLMKKGKRRLLKSIDIKIAALVWHKLRVEFNAGHAVAFLDGKRVLEIDNDEITGTGATGVWTKADSVTNFRNFVFSKTR